MRTYSDVYFPEEEAYTHKTSKRSVGGVVEKQRKSQEVFFGGPAAIHLQASRWGAPVVDFKGGHCHETPEVLRAACLALGVRRERDAR